MLGVHVTAADGRRLLVLSSSLFAAAALCRQTSGVIVLYFISIMTIETCNAFL
jgi:hypothetical protein